MLFQSGALFDSMSVFENIAFALREHTSWPEERIAERVAEVLGFVNLGRDVERLLPSSLSGGMKKRVSLARTVALKPEVLLYDEPTTGLDPVTSMTINRLIKDLNVRLGTTSVVVTHDIVSALFVADRITFLKNARFAFTGTPEEAKDVGRPGAPRVSVGGGRFGMMLERGDRNEGRHPDEDARRGHPLRGVHPLRGRASLHRRDEGLLRAPDVLLRPLPELAGPASRQPGAPRGRRRRRRARHRRACARRART